MSLLQKGSLEGRRWPRGSSVRSSRRAWPWSPGRAPPSTAVSPERRQKERKSWLRPGKEIGAFCCTLPHDFPPPPNSEGEEDVILRRARKERVCLHKVVWLVSSVKLQHHRSGIWTLVTATTGVPSLLTCLQKQLHNSKQVANTNSNRKQQQKKSGEREKEAEEMISNANSWVANRFPGPSNEEGERLSCE